ncbi:hypothetical protein ACM01_05065 [Streptomyces viridochromogenes]|uniref:DUF5919 domain-containing protein n=1 Tax=Streptomyces viridochromogenes TaxID=1938 RepID=A0A0J7ZKN4_STRVR|nr:DUF5919 domain-containing protein [Streptomyces viridochromogenes]KMS76551.1 hypothetical protein ACM01_05065 [Streptomyces viridochromogenes]
MRVTVATLAKAQGLRDDFDSLQRLRHGKGITSPGDLCYLSDFVKRRVLGIDDDTDSQLKQGLDNLKKLIEGAPPRERQLLKLSFNIDCAWGDYNWLDRVEDFALMHAWIGSSRNVRHQADLALLQLLMRACPAAEREPAPQSDVEAATDPATVHGHAPTVVGVFVENYVHNSPRFAGSWETARTVDMCGFGHNRMAVTYSNEIGRILRTGGRVRVLMQDPEGQAVLDANRRSSTPKASAEDVRHQHRSAIATFTSIRIAADAPTESLQLRVYDIMPPFTAYFFDVDEETAHAYIWFWSWRQPSAWRPGFLVSQATDTLWYTRFRSQFEAMWTDEETREFRHGGGS